MFVSAVVDGSSILAVMNNVAINMLIQGFVALSRSRVTAPGVLKFSVRAVPEQSPRRQSGAAVPGDPHLVLFLWLLRLIVLEGVGHIVVPCVTQTFEELFHGLLTPMETSFVKCLWKARFLCLFSS